MTEYGEDMRSQEMGEKVRSTKLLAAEKRALVTTLLSRTTHDFNNILVPILMVSDHARSYLEEGSRAYGDFELVHQSALRAKEMILEMLAPKVVAPEERNHESTAHTPSRGAE